jgi:hypothetical protein
VSGGVVSQPNNFDADFGYNASDARHTASFTANYKLCKDEKVRPQDGWWGWTIGPTVTARSGLPLIIRLDRPNIVYVDNAGNIFGGPAVGRTAIVNTPGGGAWVPDLVAGENPLKGNGVVLLNPAAFSIPKPGQFGFLKRGQLLGPDVFQVDLSLKRTLFLTKYENQGVLAELKFEVFNLFNRANFANPTTSLPSSLGTSLTGERIQPSVPYTRLAAGSFGVITAADPGRAFQFTVSFKFNNGY